MIGFEKWVEHRLCEESHKCPNCGNAFTTPDWLDTNLSCPKCQQPVNRTSVAPNVASNPAKPAEREWSKGERNHYLGRGN